MWLRECCRWVCRVVNWKVWLREKGRWVWSREKGIGVAAEGEGSRECRWVSVVWLRVWRVVKNISHILFVTCGWNMFLVGTHC